MVSKDGLDTMYLNVRDVRDPVMFAAEGSLGRGGAPHINLGEDGEHGVGSQAKRTVG